MLVGRILVAGALLALLGCEGEADERGYPLLLDRNPHDPALVDEGGGGPFAPRAGGAPAPSTPEGVSIASPSANPYDPAHYGAGDEEEEEGEGAIVVGRLRDFLCQCLAPGDWTPSVSYHACASNPFEAANFSVKKVQCIWAGGCSGCVCYPGIDCIAKG